MVKPNPKENKNITGSTEQYFNKYFMIVGVLFMNTTITILNLQWKDFWILNTSSDKNPYVYIFALQTTFPKKDATNMFSIRLQHQKMKILKKYVYEKKMDLRQCILV